MARLRAGSLLRLTTPVRSFAHRFSFLLLILAALTIIAIGRVEKVFVEHLRTSVTDVVTPIVDLISRPVMATQTLFEEMSSLVLIREENQRLHTEITSLQQLNLTLERLAIENKNLRSLMHFVPDAKINYVTARTIADSGSAFVRSVLVNAGKRDGVKKGDPVINGEGVVGRISHLGNHSSRAILMTDWNSRIPVLLESSRERAILVGDNTNYPHLRYLPEGTATIPGERIVTSGHGGVFPPGLPIGTVGSVAEEGIRVQPFVTWSRLELVRVLDYGLEGVLPFSLAGSEAKEAPRK